MTSPALRTTPLRPRQARVLDRVVAELEELSDRLGRPLRLDWGEELTLRARTLGTWPEGRVSGSGSCRIVRAADGWAALNLARQWDLDALPAVLERAVGDDPWEEVERWASSRTADHVVERARLLGVAAARHDALAPTTPVPSLFDRRWEPGRVRPLEALLVVDLSALWAGPLSGRLLAEAGATVVKVEDASRPDGARQTPAFYDSLHPAGQPSASFDLRTVGGRSELRRLVGRADVVIEAARPRALAQLGCGPNDVRPRRGRVWLSITGHGRAGEAGNWIAFGDDAAVAGGLTAADGSGEPAFCGDAVADPVTGLFAAAAVLRSLASGGGHLLDVPLAGAAAAVARGVLGAGHGCPPVTTPPRRRG